MNAANVITVLSKLPLASLARGLWRGLLVFAWPLVLVVKAPLAVLALTAAAVVYVALDGWLLAAATAAPVLFAVVWSRVHPRSWAPIRARLLGSIRGPLLYRWRWRRLCLACGLTKKNKTDGEDHAPVLARVRAIPAGDELRVRLLPGQIPDDFIRRADDLAHALGAREVGVTCPKPGWVRLTVARRDVLARPLTLSSVPPILNPAKVPYAVGEDGLWRHRSYVNVSGEVGGGLPGSGKTAGETSLMVGLAQNPAVQFVVIDGKGGDDWSWIRSRASIYIADDDDFTTVRDTLRTVARFAQQRIRTQRAMRGNSNFWNMPLVPEHPWLIVIVDEVQTWTENAAVTNKEDKALAAEITALLGKLVKKYRSAGVLTRLLTQKPTGDTLPTHIRDNTSIRTSWRVLSRTAAESILGDGVLATSTISPVDIPVNLRGVAVVADDKANLERVRFPYVPESAAERMAHQTAHLRRDITDLIPSDEDVSLERLTPDGHPLPPAPPTEDTPSVTNTAPAVRELEGAH